MLTHGGRNDIYGQTYGAGYFYEDSAAIQAFDNRISAILNYEGAHSGRVWKDWSEVIMGFNLQNEPFASETSKCFLDSAEDWICGRSVHMREVLGANNPIKVASGGFGGDISHGCTFVGMGCGSLDIVSGMSLSHPIFHPFLPLIYRSPLSHFQRKIRILN